MAEWAGSHVHDPYPVPAECQSSHAQFHITHGQIRLDMEVPAGPPPAYTREDATYAQVALGLDKTIELGSEFKNALSAFRDFLTSQENDRLNRCGLRALRLLRSRAVHVLEECAKYKNEGGDPSLVLSIITELSKELEKGPQWEEVIADPSATRGLESAIGNAFDRLEDQMRQMAKGEGMESTMYKHELEKARENDRKKIEDLEDTIRNLQGSIHQTPNEALQNSIKEKLKIIGDSSPHVLEKQIDARRSLAVIAELTGKSLPASTMLDRKFVTIGNQAISQGSSYDVFVGEYFTGEKIAIKVLRHRVDEETAKRTHQINRELVCTEARLYTSILWSWGDAVTGFTYRVPTTSYVTFAGSLRLSLIPSPFKKRYIKMYPKVAAHARLQMALDIARGLEYMHEGDDLLEGKGMVHSALNIYNVLVKDSGRAVISGFGHAKLYRDPKSWMMLFSRSEAISGRDEPPFGQKTRGTKIIQMIGTNKRPERASHTKIEEYENSDEIWQLFEDCWKRQPEERPSAHEVVQRFRPLVREFGKKSDTTVQKPPPPSHPRTEYGRSDPSVKQGVPPPGQHQLGKPDQPTVQGQSPASGTGGVSGGAQDGRATKPVAPGSTPPPPTLGHAMALNTMENQPPLPYASSIERPSAALAEIEAKIDQFN
ncbi:Pkinase domain-containing protein [Rhizoctonia solani AG-1 IA]|uniref:Pkinase domain-containing protein n=1 Tax=Thanatephorus cucumeris (strain AG1-IA) TaxID=983506 RepID=L8WKL0_THACA|nr:Pkinase domain-containing protein [Rhizoctonia solani AG-1 IA]